MRTNSIISLLAFGLGASLLTSCDPLDFSINQAIPEQMIQGSPVPAVLSGVFAIPLNVNINSQIVAQDTGAIQSVTIDDIELDITKTDEPAGDTDDWSFITHVEVTLKSTKAGTTLPVVTIATVDGNTTQKLIFNVDTSINVKPYIDEGGEIDASGTGMQPPDAVSYDGTASFTVHPL